MSQFPGPPPHADDLQFNTVERAAADPATQPAGPICLGCKRPIERTYYALADKVICESCRDQVTAAPPGNALPRVLKATVFGLGAGLVGALIWYLIRHVAHVEIGLVAILVGFMVAKGVRKGTGGRGGRGYQVLAVVLTYVCIAVNYMPDDFMALVETSHRQRTAAVGHGGSVSTPVQAPTDAGRTALGIAVLLVFVFCISLAHPFLLGAQNVIGLLIIGFALWEAWKLTAHRSLPITGPFQVGGGLAPPRHLGVRA